MTGSEDRPLDTLLAGLLLYGTWLASSVIGVGLAMTFLRAEWSWLGTHVVAAGVALFIGLPVVRVLLMLAIFVKVRDWRLVLVASMVLLTVLTGLAIGLSLANPPSH